MSDDGNRTMENKQTQAAGTTSPVYVAIQLTSEATQTLMQHVEQLLPVSTYTVKRGADDPGHITLCFHKDFATREEYDKCVQERYAARRGAEIEFQVTGYAADPGCCAAVVELVDPSSSSIKSTSRQLHITLMLHNKQPVYSNELINRLGDKTYTPVIGEHWVHLEQPIRLMGRLMYSVQTLRDKKKKTSSRPNCPESQGVNQRATN